MVPEKDDIRYLGIERNKEQKKALYKEWAISILYGVVLFVELYYAPRLLNYLDPLSSTIVCVLGCIANLFLLALTGGIALLLHQESVTATPEQSKEIWERFCEEEAKKTQIRKKNLEEYLKNLQAEEELLPADYYDDIFSEEGDEIFSEKQQ